MTRRQWIVLGVLAVLAALFVWVALDQRTAPWLPRDDAHARFVNADECMICHGFDGPSPQSRSHPVRRDCMDCHGMPR